MSETFDSRPENLKHIREVQSIMFYVINELLLRARDHDAVKLSSPEVEYFNKYTPLLKTLVYGSEEYEESRKLMQPALDHHYANSPHHPEHKINGILGMSLIDIVEMLCDWLAACRRHDAGDIRKSIEINQDRFQYSDELKAIFHNTIDVIAKESDLKTPKKVTVSVIRCSRCHTEAFFDKSEQLEMGGKDITLDHYQCPNQCQPSIEVPYLTNPEV